MYFSQFPPLGFVGLKIGHQKNAHIFQARLIP